MLYRCLCQVLVVNLLFLLILAYIQVNDVNYWNKATKAQCTRYSEHLNDALTIIDLSSPFLKCKYLSCTDCDHIDAIDNTCDTVVKCCTDSGLTSIPSSRLNVREVPGWNDEVRQAKDQSLFWHWIWLDSRRTNTGHVYVIMKRTRHQYHYSIRRCKLDKQEIQRTKLAENILDPTMCWSELNKISSVGKQISDTVGNASESKKIAQLFHDKYKA